MIMVREKSPTPEAAEAADLEVSKLEKSERAAESLRKEFYIGSAFKALEIERMKANTYGVEAAQRKLAEDLQKTETIITDLTELRRKFPDYGEDMHGKDDEAVFALIMTMSDAASELGFRKKFPVDDSKEALVKKEEFAKKSQSNDRGMIEWRLDRLKLAKSALAGEMGDIPGTEQESDTAKEFRKNDRMDAAFSIIDMTSEARSTLLKQVEDDIKVIEQGLTELEEPWKRQLLSEDGREGAIREYAGKSAELKAKLKELDALMDDFAENYTKGKYDNRYIWADTEPIT